MSDWYKLMGEQHVDRCNWLELCRHPDGGDGDLLHRGRDDFSRVLHDTPVYTFLPHRREAAAGTQGRRGRQGGPSAAEVIANLPPPPLAVAKNTQANGIIGASGAAASMCDGGDGGCGQ